MNPSPRSIGHALADAVKPRVITAQRYLDEWSAMATAGVPPHELRHALDRDVHRTVAMDALKAWDGKGCLALVGALESGKSHAASLWMLQGVRKGRRCAWVSSSMLLSWTDVEAAMTRATTADRFVFDDGGVGTISQTAAFAEKLEAVLSARHSRSAPTVFTSNCNRAGFEQIVGARVLSRMKAAGEIVDIREELDLRAPEAEETDKHGHGDRWRRSHRFVSTFGHKYDDRFDEATNRVELRVRVGDALESKRLDVAQLEALAEEHLVGWSELIEQAEAADQRAEQSALELVAAVSSIKSKPRHVERYVARRNDDAVTSPAPPPIARPPRWVGENPKLELGQLGYTVTRDKYPSGKKARTWTVKWKGSTLDTCVATEPLGWKIAAGHVGWSLPPGYTETDEYTEATTGHRV